MRLSFTEAHGIDWYGRNVSTDTCACCGKRTKVNQGGQEVAKVCFVCQKDDHAECEVIRRSTDPL